MEVVNRRGGTNRTNGTLAYAFVPEAMPREENLQNEPSKKPVPRTVVRLSIWTRFWLVISIFIVSAATLVVILRYSGITSQYTEINRLRGEIESVETHIRTLNVALECAVNIKAVQETAKGWGMAYPTAEQYVRAGEPLPNAELPEVSEPDMPDTSDGDG